TGGRKRFLIFVGARQGRRLRYGYTPACAGGPYRVAPWARLPAPPNVAFRRSPDMVRRSLRPCSLGILSCLVLLPGLAPAAEKAPPAPLSLAIEPAEVVLANAWDRQQVVVTARD